MRALLLVNRVSGGYSEAFVSKCISLMRRVDVSVTVSYPASRGEFRDSLMKVAEEYDVIIIGGGDGTVSLSVNTLRGESRPIVVMPLGRGNTFYKSVYGDADPCHVILESLTRGVVRRVDLGYIVDLDRFFVLGASLGFMAEAVERAGKYRFLGGRAAYALAAIEGIIVGVDAPYCITEVDGSIVYKGSASLLAVGLTKYRAGRFKLFPDAELDDGRIDYLVIPSLPRLRALSVYRASLKGLHVGFEGVVYGSGSQIRFNCTGDLMAEVDGDLVGRLKGMSIAVRRGALSILTPSR